MLGGLWVLLIRIFLSTLSLRRATICSAAKTASDFYFYPRSPCGERLLIVLMISLLVYFYPRSPCGERRLFWTIFLPSCGISIHALLAESDARCRLLASSEKLFLSTLSLRRATTHGAQTIKGTIIFLSTLSLRRATQA